MASRGSTAVQMPRSAMDAVQAFVDGVPLHGQAHGEGGEEEEEDEEDDPVPSLFGPLTATSSRRLVGRDAAHPDGGPGIQMGVTIRARLSGGPAAAAQVRGSAGGGAASSFKAAGAAGAGGGITTLEREEQIEFHASHFLVMIAYNICPVLSLPVGLLLEPLSTLRQCQVLPNTVGAFLNTWLPFTLVVLSMVFAFESPIHGPLPRQDCLAFAVTGMGTWMLRVVLVAVRYGYMSKSSFNRFRTGRMTDDEFNSSLLATSMNPSPELVEKELFIAAALRDIDLDNILFIVSPDMQEIMRTEYLAHGLTMDCVDRVVSMKSFLKGMVLDHVDPSGIRTAWILALMQTTIFVIVFGVTVGPILDTSVFPILLLITASMVSTQMTAVVYALLTVGALDFRRRASMLARIDSLIAVRPALVPSDQDIPKIEASEPLIDLTWISNATSWLNVRQIAKTYGAHVLARVQVVYTIWIVGMLFVLLFMLLSVDKLIAAPAFCAFALTLAYTLYLSGSIILDGARANDATANAVLNLRQAVTSLGLRYAYARTPSALAREGIEDIDFEAISTQAPHLRMAEMALINIIEALQLEDRKYPITFLGIAASRTLLTSLGTLAVSGVVAGLRTGIPALIDYIEQSRVVEGSSSS